jgi:hypothetical protein
VIGSELIVGVRNQSALVGFVLQNHVEEGLSGESFDVQFLAGPGGDPGGEIGHVTVARVALVRPGVDGDPDRSVLHSPLSHAQNVRVIMPP